MRFIRMKNSVTLVMASFAAYNNEKLCLQINNNVFFILFLFFMQWIPWHGQAQMTVQTCSLIGQGCCQLLTLRPLFLIRFIDLQRSKQELLQRICTVVSQIKIITGQGWSWVGRDKLFGFWFSGDGSPLVSCLILLHITRFWIQRKKGEFFWERIWNRTNQLGD